MTPDADYIEKQKAISTHILTKRMTIYGCDRMEGIRISTHILTKRMTCCDVVSACIPVFQLTSSRRGWRYLAGSLIEEDSISTHILTKRMTTRWKCRGRKESISTHILTKRMTYRRMLFVMLVDAFQLTSSRRGWRSGCSSIGTLFRYFNSHPHEEDDIAELPAISEPVISTHILTKRMTNTRSR